MEDTYSQSSQENTPPAGGSRNNTVVWFGVTLIAALLGLAGGLGLGSLILEPSETTAPSATLAELSQLQEQVQGLQSDLDTRTAESLALASDLETAGALEADLRAQIAQRDAQVGAAPQEDVLALGNSVANLEEQLRLALTQLESGNGSDILNVIKESANTVEKHRLLLVEMRRDIPVDREEARAYWSNLKSIAAEADPVSGNPHRPHHSENRQLLRLGRKTAQSERIRGRHIPGLAGKLLPVRSQRIWHICGRLHQGRPAGNHKPAGLHCDAAGVTPG